MTASNQRWVGDTTELVTRDGKLYLADYIEVLYTQQRMHSALGYASPAEFERAASEKLVA